MALTDQDTAVPPFSEKVKAASWGAHSDAEHAPFMQELMKGTLSRDGYATLVAQHWYVYDVLEQAARAMADDPVGGRFVFPELTRLPALVDDLEYLLGPQWSDRIEPVPATVEYCDRLREVCFDWAGGFIAHHYVRYMGDLSGGQIVGRVVERLYDLPDGRGVAFYAFDSVADATEFKAAYRSKLDDLPWDVAEQDRVTDEILVAYDLNTRVLVDLA